MSAAAIHDLYELANAYARARAAHADKPSEHYVWMETSLSARLLKTNRTSGQHVRFQDPCIEYPVPVSIRELDGSARGYLEVRHSESTVVISYSSNTSIWCFGDKLKKQIQKLWPKYYIIEED